MGQLNAKGKRQQKIGGFIERFRIHTPSQRQFIKDAPSHGIPKSAARELLAAARKAGALKSDIARKMPGGK